MFKKLVIGILAVSASNMAIAATQTWDFVNGSGSSIENNDAHGLGSGSYIDMSVGGIEAVISAWSSTGATGSCSGSDPTCDGGSSAYDPDPFIRRADLVKWDGGLGAVSQYEGGLGAPHHAFDNVKSYDSEPYDYDMALIQFDTEVLLEEIDINWKGADSDITVLNYAGISDLSGAPFSSSSTWYELLSQGWNHVGNYADVQTNQNQVISGTFESKYWLVGVYNPAFGGNWSYGNDSFKLAGVTTSTRDPSTQVPEPATFALLLAGLAAVGRRKFSK